MRWNLVVAMFLTAILSFATSAATNAKSLTCNNCDLVGYRNLAVTAGTGEHFVADYGKSVLTRWYVYYDRELGGWIADPAGLEPWQQDAFSDLATAVKLSGRLSPQIVITIRPGDPIWQGVMADNTFNNVDAFALARDRTLRSQFSNAWGAGLTGGSQSANNVLMAAASALLKGIGAIIGDVKITITFVWSDGSKTVFTIEENTVNKPVYQAAQSEASNGTIIPDESAAPGTSESCPTCYIGEHTLASDADLTRWFDNARLFGISIVDPGAASSSKKVSCAWDGTTLTCKLI